MMPRAASKNSPNRELRCPGRYRKFLLCRILLLGIVFVCTIVSVHRSYRFQVSRKGGVEY